MPFGGSGIGSGLGVDHGGFGRGGGFGGIGSGLGAVGHSGRGRGGEGSSNRQQGPGNAGSGRGQAGGGPAAAPEPVRTERPGRAARDLTASLSAVTAAALGADVFPTDEDQDFVASLPFERSFERALGAPKDFFGLQRARQAFETGPEPGRVSGRVIRGRLARASNPALDALHRQVVQPVFDRTLPGMTPAQRAQVLGQDEQTLRSVASGVASEFDAFLDREKLRGAPVGAIVDRLRTGGGAAASAPPSFRSPFPLFPQGVIPNELRSVDLSDPANREAVTQIKEASDRVYGSAFDAFLGGDFAGAAQKTARNIGGLLGIKEELARDPESGMFGVRGRFEPISLLSNLPAGMGMATAAQALAMDLPLTAASAMTTGIGQRQAIANQGEAVSNALASMTGFHPSVDLGFSPAPATLARAQASSVAGLNLTAHDQLALGLDLAQIQREEQRAASRESGRGDPRSPTEGLTFRTPAAPSLPAETRLLRAPRGARFLSGRDPKIGVDVLTTGREAAARGQSGGTQPGRLF